MPGHLAHELLLGEPLGGGEIERSAELPVLREEDHGPHEVLPIDPGEGLPAVPDHGLGLEPSHAGQPRECASVGREHDAEAGDGQPHIAPQLPGFMLPGRT